MPKYLNGQIPSSDLIKVDSGRDANGYWEFLMSPGLLARWNALKAYSMKKWGKRPFIRTGWNCYRPYNIQAEARARAAAAGTPLQAAWPGTSSHGGTWRNQTHTRGVEVDALAIDVEPGELSWTQVYEAGRAVGFLCGAITRAIAGIDEPWHIIDLDPWRAVPASTGSTPFEEDDMSAEAEKKIDEIRTIIGQLADLRPGRPNQYSDRSGFAVIRAGRNYARKALIETRANGAAIQALASAKGIDPAPILAAIAEASERPLTLSDEQMDQLAARINSSPEDMKTAMREVFAEAFGNDEGDES